MTIKSPILRSHQFSSLSQYTSCRKVVSIAEESKTLGIRGYIWQDEVSKNFRHIYIRCLSCLGIFEIGNKSGSRNEPIMIDETRRVGPCIVCPLCTSHVWTILLSYRPGTVPDVFVVNLDAAREYENTDWRRG